MGYFWEQSSVPRPAQVLDLMGFDCCVAPGGEGWKFNGTVIGDEEYF